MNKIMFYSMTMHSGGAERVVANLANEFIKKNDVSIATLVNSNIDYELNRDVKVIPASSSDSQSLFSRIKSTRKLLKNTKEYNPNIVIAFCPTMCFIACFYKMFIRKLKKIKIIISERNDPNSEYKNRFLKFLANHLYSKADIIVFQTEGAKNFFCKKVQEKGVIIPNPINDKFLNINKNVKKENCIVNVGRLELQKNQELLIKVCSEVFKKYPNWKLKIYGEGSLKEKLNNIIKELKMEKNIFLEGKCYELEKELPKSKIFVLSSNFEGMPNALMEAMACGLACISTDCPCGGPRELIVNNENGLLIPVNDANEMKKSIINLIESSKLYAKFHNCNIKLFSQEEIYQKWYELL